MDYKRYFYKSELINNDDEIYINEDIFIFNPSIFVNSDISFLLNGSKIIAK